MISELGKLDQNARVTQTMSHGIEQIYCIPVLHLIVG